MIKESWKQQIIEHAKEHGVEVDFADDDFGNTDIELSNASDTKVITIMRPETEKLVLQIRYNQTLAVLLDNPLELS